jgi:hypothetical protein
MDFALVSTYVPLLLTIARALLLTCVAQFTSMLPVNVVSAGILFLVYVDAHTHVNVHTSHIASHLMPVAFLLLTHSKDAVLSDYEASIAVDMLWACVCVVLWAANVFRWRSRPVWATTLVTSIMTLAHLYYTRDSMSLVEVCTRVVMFYISCFVHYHAFVCRVSCDAASHAFVGPHVCLYVLFLQRYILFGAVVLTTLLLCQLWVGDKRFSAWSEQRADKPQLRTILPHVYDTGMEGGVMDDLLVELRQAQASRV